VSNPNQAQYFIFYNDIFWRDYKRAKKEKYKIFDIIFFYLKCISNYFDKQFSIMVRKNIQALFVNV